MSLKQNTTILPVAPVPQEGADPVEKRSGLAGLLLLMIGALLLALAAENALAESARSGGGTDFLQGTADGERLAGLGGSDVIEGLAGDDELYGGDGRDELLGGAGGDFLEAEDGGVDFVRCGSGVDVASVDLNDRVARDCEKFYPG